MIIDGRYRIDGSLGIGGMGEVHLATDLKLDRQVAVKFVSRKEDIRPELVKRFLRECSLMARLDHPGIPRVYDKGTVEDPESIHHGSPFLVMEKVDGTNLEYLGDEDDPLSLGWSASVVAQAAAIVHYAHGQGVVHRDLKPSNLMLTRQGEVKVLDFGLASAFADPDQTRLTSTGRAMGTWHYMAPEQFDQAPCGPWTDVYALGAILHRLLTGLPPFNGTEAQIVGGHLGRAPEPLRGIRPDTSPEIERLVLAMLAKKPDDRPGMVDVYQTLLPYAVGIGEIPGVVPRGLSTVRMYASVLAQITAEPGSARPPVDLLTPPEEQFTEGDIDRALRRASALVRDSHYAEAVKVLGQAVRQGTTLLGADHSAILSLRMEQAEVMMTAGDYTEAARSFAALAVQYATRDREMEFACRMRQANCLAMLGATGQALNLLESLREDQIKAYGPDDTRVADLRHQIILLLDGTGATARAVELLEELIADGERIHGTDHPTVRSRRADLAKMRRRL